MCSISLVMKEMQMKSLHKFKRLRTPNADKDIEELKLFTHYYWECKEQSLTVSYIKLNVHLS